jgi:hypothetical protein
VLAYIAEHVLGSGWTFTFAHIDPTEGAAKRADPELLRFWSKFPWWLYWGGIVQEAESGDLPSLIDRLTSHTEANEVAGRRAVRSEDLPGWLDEVLPQYPEDGTKNLVVCSRVEDRRQGGRQHGTTVRHIPMMDFRCEPSDRNRELVIMAMRKLGQQNGVVLESGRSYHYYGFDLLDEASWRDFMYRCLLLAPFTDSRYIGHRLLGGTARLRISASRHKPAVPHVVAVLDLE